MDRFSFNPETLSYQRIESSGTQKLFRFLFFLALSMLIGTGFLILRDRGTLSPRAQKLVVEQEKLVFGLDMMNRDINTYENALSNVAYHDDHIYRVYFEQQPWPATLREAGVGGYEKYSYLEKFKHGDLLVNTYQNVDRIERKLVVQSTSFDQVIDMAATKEERLAARPAIQPVSLKDLTRFGSSFGMRFHPLLKVWKPHEGIDLTAPRGTPIFATADGEVLQAGYRPGGYGKKILVDHGYGYRTLYGHCDEVLVSVGQEVKRGEVIGRVGSTGLSKSPHLHYEVHINGRPVDPIDYYANDLSTAEFDRMISMLSDADPSFDIN